MRLSGRLITASYLVLAISSSLSAQSIEKNTSLSLPEYEEVINRVSTLGKSDFRMREIYVYLREENFTQDVFIKILNKIQSANCDPYSLVITMFSDRDQLLKRSRVDRHPTTIHFGDDERGKLAAAEHYGKLYPTSGFYEAVYSRSSDFELIDYDLEKEPGGSKRLFIRVPSDSTKYGPVSSKLAFSKCKQT